MKKRNRKVYFSLFFALALIFQSLSLAVVTVTADYVHPLPSEQFSDVAGEEELMIPEAVTAQAIGDRRFVRRLPEEETDLNRIVFENEDGTKTTYIYGVPVKYKTADGEVRDKSTHLSDLAVLLDGQVSLIGEDSLSSATSAALGRLTLSRFTSTMEEILPLLAGGAAIGDSHITTDLAYAVLDNDVYTLFSERADGGAALIFGKTVMRLIPSSDGVLSGDETMHAGGSSATSHAALAEIGTTATGRKKEQIVYENAFGHGTTLRYTPTLNGMKQEILLHHSGTGSRFSFLMNVGGASIQDVNGRIQWSDPENPEETVAFRDLLVYDASGRVTKGTYTLTSTENAGQYLLTLEVPQEYLQEATYPVTVAPHINRIDIFGMAEDTGLYDRAEANDYTFEEFHNVGSTTYGDVTFQGAALYRFPILYMTALGGEVMDPLFVASYQLHLQTGAGSATGFSVFAYTKDWQDDTRICDADMYAGIDETQPAGVTWSAGNDELVLDMTVQAREWLADMQENLYDIPDQGFALCKNDGDCCIVVAFGESEASYLVLDTGSYGGTYYINSLDRRMFLGGANSSSPSLVSGTVAEKGADFTWTLEYAGDQCYYIHPGNSTSRYLSIRLEYLSAPSAECLWRIESGPSGYTLANTYFNYPLAVNTSGRVVTDVESCFTEQQKTWRIIKADNYAEFSPPNQTVYLTVSPEELTTYTLPGYERKTWCRYTDYVWTLVSGVTFTQNNGVFSSTTATGYTQYEVQHLPTGITVTLNMTVIEPEEGFHRIGSGSSALEAGTDGLHLANAVTDENVEGFGKQLWYFQYLGEGQYRIYNYGVKNSATQTADMVLAQVPRSSSLTLEPASSRSNQIWKLGYATFLSSDIYSPVLINQQSGLCLAVISGGLDMMDFSVPFVFAPVSLAPKHSDWSECEPYYNLTDNGSIYVLLEVTSEVAYDGQPTDENDRRLNKTVIENAALQWNGISPRVHVYVRAEDVPSGVPITKWWVIPHTGASSDTLGQASMKNYCILLNVPELYKLGDATVMSTTTHEMGHMLSLSHPREGEDGDAGYLPYLAVMNQGASTFEYKVITPTEIDRYQLRNVWG